MKPIKYIVTLLFIASSVVPSFAFDSTAADQAYHDGNYELATALYSEAIANEGISAGMLYNLGNCYYKLDKEADAMLCYERASKLDPGNKLIRQNLDFLSGKVLDSNRGALQGKEGNVEPDAESFIDSVYRIIAIDHRSNGWAVFAVMAFILFVGALSLYTFTPNILARKTGFFSGLVFFGFTVIFIVFAFMAASKASRQDEAILMGFTTELLQRPEASAPKASTPLHKGTKIKILDVKKGVDGTEWLQVKLNSDNIGWVRKQDLEII